MLVLSRHKEESIMVGDNVEIKIISIRRNEIQLGINAPNRSLFTVRKYMAVFARKETRQRTAQYSAKVCLC